MVAIPSSLDCTLISARRQMCEAMDCGRNDRASLRTSVLFFSVINQNDRLRPNGVVRSSPERTMCLTFACHAITPGISALNSHINLLGVSITEEATRTLMTAFNVTMPGVLDFRLPCHHTRNQCFEFPHQRACFFLGDGNTQQVEFLGDRQWASAVRISVED